MMNNRQLMRKETLMGSSLEFRQLLGGCLTVRDDILLELNKDNVGSQHFSGHFIKRHFLKPVHDSN